jgi:hypothetical protein
VALSTGCLVLPDPLRTLNCSNLACSPATRMSSQPSSPQHYCRAGHRHHKGRTGQSRVLFSGQFTVKPPLDSTLTEFVQRVIVVDRRLSFAITTLILILYESRLYRQESIIIDIILWPLLALCSWISGKYVVIGRHVRLYLAFRRAISVFPPSCGAASGRFFLIRLICQGPANSQCSSRI